MLPQKEGPTKIIPNYPPISPSPKFSRVFAQILLGCIYSAAEDKLNPHLFCFRNKRGAVPQLFDYSDPTQTGQPEVFCFVYLDPQLC